MGIEFAPNSTNWVAVDVLVLNISEGGKRGLDRCGNLG